NHYLSVIVPIYNEPQFLENIKIIEETLKKSFADFEIICVEDGHNGLLKTKSRKNHSSRIKIISYPFNVGKGFALAYGFSQSKGNLVAFLDGDLDIHPRQLRLFVDLLDLVNADIVIGSKRHPLSRVQYPLLRRIYSLCYQLFVKILFGLNISDTQVGIKIFRRKVLREVIPRLVVKAWAFDLEVLVVAHHLGYRKIIEAPVEIKMRRFGSKIGFGAIRNILTDTAAIFYRRYLLHHYDQNIPSPYLKIRRKKRIKKSPKK
ncbi:MAG: glycosyltransferase, partial [bacterium]|nr:glycosyltransferase [bacterium]